MEVPPPPPPPFPSSPVPPPPPGPVPGPPPAATPGPVESPPPAPPGWAAGDAAPPRRSGLALASMILGIIGLVLCLIFIPSLLALIFGLVAAGQIKRSGGALSGSGLARAGWIMGAVGLVAGAGFWALGASGAFDDGETGVFDVEAGECVSFDFELDSDIPDEITTVEVVDCDEPHDAVVIQQGELNPDEDREYPSNRVLLDEAAAGCGVADLSNIITVFPNEESWDEQGGPYVCFEISDA